MICDEHGEVRRPLADPPGETFRIEKMIKYKNGFICVGDRGQMIVYSQSSEPNTFAMIAHLPNFTDEKMSEQQKKIVAEVVNSTIKSIDLSPSNDSLVFTTESQQIFRMTISSLDNKNVEAVYEYLVHPFHSRPITGMDVCIKKNLIATCSADRTVKIWSYSASNDFELQIN